MVKNKFYSDVTKQFYDSIEDANRAELAVAEKNKQEDEAKKARAEAAKKVDEARKAVEDAMKAWNKANESYRKILADFCKKYGAYHTTFKGIDDDFSFSDIISAFLDF